MAYPSGIGVSRTLLPGPLQPWAQEEPAITAAVLADAEKIAGPEFSEQEREAMLRGLTSPLSGVGLPEGGCQFRPCAAGHPRRSRLSREAGPARAA